MGCATSILHPDIYGANTVPRAADVDFFRKDLLVTAGILSFFIVKKIILNMETIIY
jgi:hypothetical protein